MKKLLAILCLLFIVLSCVKSNDRKTNHEETTERTDFWEMKKDSKYEFFLSGGEDQIYVKSYEFKKNGCCKVEFLRRKWDGVAIWDTAIVCGSFIIRTYEKR